ncbi:hypothetical protein MVEN_00366000 [Mycena venus]|uniref:Uncharacterized protein n=1 Tax=Mycena venus TaxID=2733690 RepID=A0A8H6YTL3_9AGAR|nr:hypothetical protein MVEN_00366000 [Mycena venus]
MQVKILEAAYTGEQGWTAKEIEKLSSETRLTSTWIKAWSGRYKKKLREFTLQKREAKSEPEDDAPPAKKARTGRRQPKVESPPPPILTSSPVPESLPPADNSYMFPVRELLGESDAPVTSSLNSVQNYPRASHADYAYHHGIPPAPLEQSLPPIQQPKSLHFIYQHPSHSGPMLLSRRYAENIDPGPQQQASAPNATPASVNSIAYYPAAPLLVPSSRTPASYAASLFVPTPIAVPRPSSLFVGNRLPPPTTVHTQLSPFCPSNKSTPVCGLQSPFDSSFSNPPSRHMHSMITPSNLRSYMPQHNIENDDSQSTSTSIDDKFLFNSMLNFTPGSPVKRTARDATTVASVPAHDDNVFDLGKTPLKYLSVLQGGYIKGEDGRAVRKMTLDEMYEPLLDEELATSDPFQAAMGLVFMSRTGLDWDAR